MRMKIIPKKPYKTRGHYVTQHAVTRMKERHISKGELSYNLAHRPIKKTKIVYNKKAEPSYTRYSDNRTCAAINPARKNVISVWWFHSSLMKKILGRGKYNEH